MIELRIILLKPYSSIVIFLGSIVVLLIQIHVSSVEVEERIVRVLVNSQVVVPDSVFKLAKMEVSKTLVVVMELMLSYVYSFVKLFES